MFDDDYEDRMHDIRQDERGEGTVMTDSKEVFSIEYLAELIEKWADGAWATAVSKYVTEHRNEIIRRLSASSLPDPTTPEGLRYAADVLIALSGDNRIPADSAWTGRVLQHEAELREKDIAAAARADADVEELAQVIFEAAGYSEHGDPERNAAKAALNWMRSR